MRLFPSLPLSSAPLLVLTLTACATSSLTESTDSRQASAEGTSLIDVFHDAEAITGIPADLLVAIADAETQLQMVEGTAEFPGQPPGFGVMGLRTDNAELGALLAGVGIQSARYDRTANVMAAAFLLRYWADEAGLDPRDVNALAPVVAMYSGIEDPEAAAEYVHYEVYAALGQGIDVEGFRVPGRTVAPDYRLPLGAQLRSGDAGAVWTPSPNYNSRGGASADFVVVHTCEGTYSGCWSWLSNGASGVSAHYVVRDDGSEVRQLVEEEDRAWHISASYACGNNGGVECWRDGTSMNTVSVGIEHAGYASQTSWDPGLISRSAELACGITQRHGIPRDSYHIVGHGQLQPWNRTDPGANWPWTDYLDQIQVACGDVASLPETAPATEIVIDSNNSANTTDTFVERSGNWWGSASVPGYWNTGYWVSSTGPVSDPVSFWFYEEASQCYAVDAWWAAAWNRPPSITWLGWDANDAEVGRAVVNQQIDGSQWNRLGDWQFGPGWNRVLLSRWSTSGWYAVADAVRLTPSSNCP